MPLNNANFETGPFNTVGTVSSWVVNGNVGNTTEGATSGTHSAALSAGTDSQGDTLSQSFISVVNQIYSVDFDAAVFGIPANGANLQVEVQALGTSTLLDQIITPPVAGSSNPNATSFTHYHFIFTADATVTTLRFTSIGLGNANADQIIDTVSVVPATPPVPFTPGNLAIFQADSASANNTAFSILELSSTTPGSNPIQIIPIEAGGPAALRISGAGRSTGYLASSNDGTLLCFTGYNSDDSSDNGNSLNPRGVGTLDQNANFALETSYSGQGNMQTGGATTLDNVNWFIAEQSGTYTNGANAPYFSGNFCNMKSFGGTVYVFQADPVFQPVLTISAPSGGTLTPLPGISAASADNQDFCLIASGVNGGLYDVLYIVTASSDTSGSINKYSLVNASWTANGNYATAFGGFGLTAAPSGSGALLYLTTGDGNTDGNSVVKLTDTAGYNATINVATANNITLYTAPLGSTAKGISFVPGPSSTLDSDGDGYSDLQEFLAGTDAHDPTSCLHISAVTQDQNGYHITFAAVAGKKYRVQRVNTLSATQWAIVADNLVASGPTMTVLDNPPSSPSHWFYRVVLIP